MLQEIREHSKGWGAKIIVGIIAVTFALFGLESLGQLWFKSDDKIASVNGEAINKAQIDEQLVRLQRSGQIAPGQEGSVRQQLIDQAVQQKLLDQYARQGQLDVSPAQVQQIIESLPQFRDAQGHFSEAQFASYLAQAGFTPKQARAQLHDDLRMRQLQEGFGAISWSTPGERRQLTALQNETRDFRYQTLNARDLPAAVTASDAEIEQYYQAHQQDFIRPEQVKLDYILLDPDTLAAKLPVSDDELKDAYARRAAAAHRRVSDIVIAIDQAQGGEAVARARMTDVQKRLTAGESFAALAKAYSSDSSSAAQGGDIGAVTPGIYGGAFDTTLKALNVGETSEPFVFDDALHLIKVTGVDLPAFDALRDTLTKDVRARTVKPKMDQLTQSLQEMSYDEDGLTNVATKLDVPLAHSDWLDKNTQTAPFNEANVMNAAFDEQALKHRYNSDLIELEKGRRMVLHVTDVRPQVQLALDQVRDQVRHDVIAAKTEQALAQLAKARVEKLQKGELSSAGWTAAKDVARDSKAPEAGIISAAFATPRPKQADHAMFSAAPIGHDQYVVIALSHVGELKKAGAEALVASDLKRTQIEAIGAGLLRDLNDKAKIERPVAQ